MSDPRHNHDNLSPDDCNVGIFPVRLMVVTRAHTHVVVI